MWDRKKIKEISRNAIQFNYWKTFFSSVIMIIISGSTSIYMVSNSANSLPSTLQNIYNNEIAGEGPYNPKIVGIIIVLVCGIVVLATFAKIVVTVFIKNPVQVGFSKFLYRTVIAKDEEDASKGQIANLVWSFDHSYLNIVKVMFFKSLFTTIGYVLLIIPGLYKFYEYRMVPYILSENPQLTISEALNTSKSMMNGHKKDMLLLDLSFIPWHLLGLITFGIVEFFYVQPYLNLTIAKAYETLSNIYYGEE